ncbi:ORC1-type DNA replication protein [Candidatus Woesearchaeota archaeon]|nr:ORC1-type DNA replication protein [Candidatus Woesearchaeota archaeon]
MENKLTNFFENFLTKEPFFINKKVLQGNYTPENILHREQQITQIAEVLAPVLRMEKPSNIFLFGKTGSGKSLVATYTTNKISEIAEKNKIPIKIFYLNCKLKRVADTEYRLISQLCRDFGVDVPSTGLPTDEIYKIFVKALEKDKILLIIVLDEIDQLVNKTGDEILYNLTRLNLELKESQISFIGISNDLMFTDNLDPRVKSSLSEEEFVFPPYDALQLQQILNERAKLAFKEGVIEEGVIEKCAAHAAREHGDARRALELLRVAGEIAERKNNLKITIKHIDMAQAKIERDRVLDIIRTQPKQFKITLYSILESTKNKSGKIRTGEIYDFYKETCKKCFVKPLTQRRLSDIIAEFDMLGIINAKVISKGRGGRTREIGLVVPNSTIPKIHDCLKEGLNL